MPLYLVKFGEPAAEVERLVEANNKAVARNHVARQLIVCELAETPDIVRLVKAGQDVEVAKDQPPEAAGAPASEEVGKPPVEATDTE